ncbi:MAG TPA: type II toxin-antitoxin system Phd/YefM family antitoxin [Thermoanaerobaculia bacterium]|nr:type II toxin-antitoxin system Phd/YefM family antitoxin [Thermoanaerobaculia bacterium]
MTVYTFSEAQQKLAFILDEAERQGAVRIKSRDGSEFEIAPVREERSPLDIEGVPLDLTAEEIVAALKESRSRNS